jgi:hypothetical protein
MCKKKSICYFKLTSVLIPQIAFQKGLRIRLEKTINEGCLPVGVSKKSKQINDNGGTRSGTERRQYNINDSTPERRSGWERRGEFDRRKNQTFRGEKAIERREFYR